MSDYIRTYMGLAFPVIPEAEAVHIQDIAVALSRAPRWGGHTREPYPVSAHSIFVSRLLPKHLKKQGLLHDASEAYLADIPSPFKALLPDYKNLETMIMRAVAEKLGFEWPIHPLVKLADAVALYEERKHLFPIGFSYDVPEVLIKNCEGLNKSAIKRWYWDEWLQYGPQDHSHSFRQEFNKLLK